MRRGLLAEFESPEALADAVGRLRADGFTRLFAFTPYPVAAVEEELAALSPRRSRIPLAALLAGLAAGGLALWVQAWTGAVDYPLDVGARPLLSWPAFVPIAFELAVLAAAFACFFGLLAAAGLPRLWHPLFEVEGFERATIDRFFLGVDAADPRFAPERLVDRLRALGALRIAHLPVETG